MTPILKPFLEPITRRCVGALANRGVALDLASILLSVCLLTGCGAEDPAEPICTRIAYLSTVHAEIDAGAWSAVP